MALVVKNLPVNAGGIRGLGSIPGLGRSPGGGHSNPLQYFCLKNPMDRGPWRATVHGVTEHAHTYPWRQQCGFRNLTCVFTCVRYRIIHCVACNSKR